MKWMSARNDELCELYCGNGSMSETNDGGDNAPTVAEVDGKISMNDAAVKKAMKYDLFYIWVWILFGCTRNDDDKDRYL